MVTLRRVLAAVVAGLSLLTAAPPAASAVPARPAVDGTSGAPHRAGGRPVIDYVALGDSYAAGYGAGTSTGACGRTSWAYPQLLARTARLQLTFVACGGATIADVARTQLAAVTESAELVSLQVGGNDVGFAPVLAVCSQPGNDAGCAAAVARSRAYLNSTFADDLTALYTAVRDRAPDAELVVVGYPRLFGARDCSPLTEFTDGERAELNSAADLLNRRLRQAARTVGARFADPRDRFENHAWCDRVPWITGPEFAAFHPNVLGQLLGYLPVVARACCGHDRWGRRPTGTRVRERRMTELKHPPVAGDEIATLRGYLDFQRDVLRRKTEGLRAEQLNRPLAPTTMTLAGLLKHTALVEVDWLVGVFRGEPLGEPWAAVDWASDPDWEWHSASADTPEELRRIFDDAVRRADAVLDDALGEGAQALDTLAAQEHHGRRVSLRWILAHLIEEEARHLGHADLLREAIDGSVGD